MHIRGYTPTHQHKQTAQKHRNTRQSLSEAASHGAAKARVPIDGERAEARTGSREAETDVVGDHSQLARSENAGRAKIFQTVYAPASGTRKHPELAGSYATMAAIEQRIEADGLSPQARAIFSQRVRQNIINSIERGELPNVSVLAKA